MQLQPLKLVCSLLHGACITSVLACAVHMHTQLVALLSLQPLQVHTLAIGQPKAHSQGPQTVEYLSGSLPSESGACPAHTPDTQTRGCQSDNWVLLSTCEVAGGGCSASAPLHRSGVAGPLA